MPEISHASVNRHWERVKSSILGPYMMDGFGFPVSAGDFRFRAEARIVRRLLARVEHNGAVLDLGSGIGYWAGEFARRFSQVVAVEGSNALYPALEEQCALYANIRTIHGNVLSFEPDGHYSLVFLGGLLMYLDEDDVTTLLQKLIPCLGPDGIILCRESTVRAKRVTHTGVYPVVYRSVPDYKRIFKQCGLTLKHVERNEPYVLMQMGCELIKKWKRFVPEPFHSLQIVGRLTYWGIRLGAPWIKRLPRIFGIPFPSLENHFFVLGTEPIVNEQAVRITL
ncbi:MAG: methyltransferase domain-containing protein [Gammaproteobacteria bacterium]|nr:methyltransferase domain-containing protein [Gammaproteobacteria bacterium]